MSTTTATNSSSNHLVFKPNFEWTNATLKHPNLNAVTLGVPLCLIAIVETIVELFKTFLQHAGFIFSEPDDVLPNEEKSTNTQNGLFRVLLDWPGHIPSIVGGMAIYEIASAEDFSNIFTRALYGGYVGGSYMLATTLVVQSALLGVKLFHDGSNFHQLFNTIKQVKIKQVGYQSLAVGIDCFLTAAISTFCFAAIHKGISAILSNRISCNSYCISRYCISWGNCLSG